MDKTNQNTPIIIAQDGPLKGSNWVLKNRLIIGRNENCDIAILDRQVSRTHAKIEIGKDQQFGITDLGSKNGTFVNGDRLNTSHSLMEGDVIKIALIQELIFVSSDATLPLEMNISRDDSKSLKLFIDEKARRVWIGEKELAPPLSVSQYRLLTLLFHTKNEVISRDSVIQKVWGEKEAIGVSEQALDALVRRLRSRLKKIDPTHEYIETIRGVGFLFKNESF